MFLFKTDFRKYLCILLIVTIIFGTCLVSLGGYLTDNYFSRMVKGIIGDSGEYDLILTLARDKEDIALEQVENVLESSFSGAELKEGPRVAGSSNYLLRLPEGKRTGEVFGSINSYFSGIPGLMSKTIITEPRLTLREFRGESLKHLRPLIDEIEGIDFSYKSGSGLDLVVKEPGNVPEVRREVKDILNNYELFELRFPLDRSTDNSENLKDDLVNLISSREDVDSVYDVSGDDQSDTMAMLRSLREMKSFLLSFAARVVVKDISSPREIGEGMELIIKNEGDSPAILQVAAVEEDGVEALLQSGSLEGIKEDPDVYLRRQDGSRGDKLGKGEIHNPRQDLARTLEGLNQITPQLEQFMEDSERLIAYTDSLNSDLDNINQGLNKLNDTGRSLDESMEKWQQEDLTYFLEELMDVLDEIKVNTGDLNQAQRELVKTSNRLKEAAGLIEEKLVFVPRDSEIYRQLFDLKEISLSVSEGLDRNYDLIEERTEDMDPVLASIDEWQDKIRSLLDLEKVLARGRDWQEVEGIVDRIDETASVLDTRELQQRLISTQELMEEARSSHLPRIIEQLEYIQGSLPEMEDEEIVDSLDLIDNYMAGRVIPGDQIQLLVKGSYDHEQVVAEARELVEVPGVNYFNLKSGMVQTNPRAEVFNVLRQVRAVISTIIALIFTLLVLILDQSLLVSVLRLQGKKGYLFSLFCGGIVFSAIYYLSNIDFPYLFLPLNFIIGGFLGLLIGLFAEMLNPVSKEEWEAGKALGYSPDEIMREIIIPAGKPGLLYLLNYPRVKLK